MSLARRTITSTTWNIVANSVKVVVLFGRSVLLARLLPVEVFGVYALAGSIVALSVVLPNFGMESAFRHRAPETEDEEQAAAVHFTFKLALMLVWGLVLMTGAFVFTSDQTRTALLMLVVARGGRHLTETPRMILTRRVRHRRLAVIELLDALLTTSVALGLAWQGATLWALLATDFVTLIVNVGALYVWRPVWRLRLAWSAPIARYYLSFGSQTFVATLLARALDRVDDLWTGLYLGETPLSFYSRAYSFATYPRSVLAQPIDSVMGGTLAELKHDRLRLSRAFFRISALLVRSGFFVAGLLALIAPEFVRLLLGEKWLPMLDAFRLMLVFTLLDPIKATAAQVFVAVGKPETVVKARFVQLVVLVISLFLLGPPFGIAGIALAVDVMLVVGIVLLLRLARAYVDFSPRRLFAVPAVALTLGFLASYVAIGFPGIAGSDWRTGFAKAVALSVTYGITLLALERDQLSEMVSALLGRSRKPERHASALSRYDD